MNLLFGEYLTDLIEAKSLDKKAFANEIGINRSRLYRLLSNEQVPDKALIDRIISVMSLRNSEARALKDSFQCSLLGRHVFEERMIIDQIVNSYLSSNRPQPIYSTTTVVNPGQMALNTQESLFNSILGAFGSELASGYCKQIRTILPAESTTAVRLINTLIEQVGKLSLDITITHVTNAANPLVPALRVKNLSQLQNMLPLVRYDTFYKVYYSEQDLLSDTVNRFFPYLISFGNQLAYVISSDFNQGICFTAPYSQTIDMINDEFDKLRTDALPLFTNMYDLEEVSKNMLTYEECFSGSTFCIQPENSFTTFPESLIQRKIKEIGETPEWSRLLLKRHQLFQKRLRRKHCYQVVPLSSIDHLTQNGNMQVSGRIRITESEQIEILENLIHMVDNIPNYHLYLMKPNHPLYRLPASFYLIESQLLYIIPDFINFDSSNNTIIRNSSLVESFNGYFLNAFERENTIMERNEVSHFLKRRLQTLKT